MFDPALPLWLRGLSLFHFPMPAAIIYMIWRFGYDPRALYPQIVLSIVVFLMTHWLTEKTDNVNIIFPPRGLQDFISEPLYVVLMPLVLVTGVIIPMHFILKKYAGPKIVGSRWR
ncbi:MAG: hypothetical protein V1721_09195 [Pseudomonadota bacterium]